MKKPSRKLVKYVLDACRIDRTDSDRVDEVRNAWAPCLARGQWDDETISMCRALCNARGYYTEKEFNILLEYVEEGIWSYRYDQSSKIRGRQA